jgi:hypothetical protein
MKGFLKEAVYEDWTVRQKIRRALNVCMGEIMQGYEDSRSYAYPQSQDEDYLFGWYMSGKNRRNKKP